ncbi:CaiB/BaiF CoA transferase family protein [Pseudohalioglobus lutimaris]|uniref:CoA transferase n=1 Tax=Pseudohalioglobus lutimaris TaxID=1737061 RepID=A0A2N5X3X2_9GAMM|nr:CoA transferase [Pseudohalioglobus lutimaris]PLW69173.1 CoA transferase [Pseudohalioglobus lutimaris]
MAKALEGIRVIDFTVWFQGPVSAQYLADFGAEVIKVENPKGGDQGRGVRSMKSLAIGDWNQYFLVINRNKKSIAIDLKKPEGQEILYRMVEKSDVFLSNLSPALLAKMNLSFDQLSAINPRLVYATNTGYGRFGGVSKPSFDMTVQALTGAMARLGEPGQPPIYMGMGSGDAYGGIMSAMGIAMAIYQRNRTGKGQCIDASLYGAQLYLAAPYLQAYLAGDKKSALQQSRKEVENPLWNLYPTAGKWLYLCEENTDQRFALLCNALGDDGLASDARFASAQARSENNVALIAAIDAITSGRSDDQLLAEFERNGLVHSPVNSYADVVEDEQAWQNNYFMKAYCEEVKREVDVRGLPVTLSKTPGEVNTLGPQLGQDTELLMMDLLEYEWEQIEEFKAKGAIP